VDRVLVAHNEFCEGLDVLARLERDGEVAKEERENDLLFKRCELLPDAVSGSGREGEPSVGMPFAAVLREEALRVKRLGVLPFIRIHVDEAGVDTDHGPFWESVFPKLLRSVELSSYHGDGRDDTMRLL